MADIIGIRIFKGESTTDVLAEDCKYMWFDVIEVKPHGSELQVNPEYTHLFEGEPSPTIPGIKVPGIRYMLNASKFPVPIIETDIFVPMTSVVQISFDLPF